MSGFETTLWHRIADAQRRDPLAVQDLVERYRPALLAFIARAGLSAEDAEDLAQEVFLRLLARNVLERADRARGRFRGFLLGVTRNVLREHRAHRGALKRGRRAAEQPLPDDELLPGAEEAEGDALERDWMENLLRRGLLRLAQEHPVQHRALHLRFSRQLSYEEVAAETARTVAQVRNDLHRGRDRLLRLLEGEVAHYASTPEELAEEVAALRRFVGRA